MADHRITLRLSNAELEGAPIRLTDVVGELEAIGKVLRRTQRSLSSISESLDWRVVEISYDSPLTVSIEPAAEPGYGAFAVRVVARFFDLAERIETGDYEGINGAVLRDFRDLATPVDGGRIDVEVLNGSRDFHIRQGLGHAIQAVLAPETTALGNIKGQLEYINLHGQTNVFRVYPFIGPSYVECGFQESLSADAKRAIGRVVRVFGRLHYRDVDDFVHRVDVREIELIPFDSDLPSLMDIQGIAPEATGPMSSEDFVRSVRSARESERQT